ncbi:MAG: CHASE2 domain-containing protein [Cyanobacteriota bacterium]
MSEKIQNNLKEFINFILNNKSKVFILVLIYFFVVLIFNVIFANGLELKAYNLRSKLRMKPASPDILIIAIDDLTLRGSKDLTSLGLGRFPWPRTAYSKVMKYVSTGKPRAIILDFLLIQSIRDYEIPQQFSDKQFIEDLKEISGVYFVHDIFINKDEFLKNIYSEANREWNNNKNKAGFEEILDKQKNKFIKAYNRFYATEQ